jgi:hypothetical protein
MQKNIETPAASVTADNIVDKRGFSAHWGFSVRKCDQLLAKGLPHLKLSARQLRINIPEADAWMHQQFATQRIGKAGSN